jgi:hypothetical protein
MIDEIYPLYCLRGLSKFPELGNPRTRKFDIFRARLGTPINFGRIYENWATDAWSVKLTGAQISSLGAAMFTIPLGIGRFPSNKGVIGLRPGNLTDATTIFEDANFILKFNGSEKYRFLGWDEVPRDFYWRLEGGERIELVVFSPGAIAMDIDDFIYVDLTVHYEPQALILEQEAGDTNVNNLPENTGRRL